MTENRVSREWTQRPGRCITCAGDRILPTLEIADPFQVDIAQATVGIFPAAFPHGFPFVIPEWRFGSVLVLTPVNETYAFVIHRWTPPFHWLR